MSQGSVISELFIKEVRTRLRDSYSRIVHCVSQLNEEQLWWRPEEKMNSIANIILHLCGNVRQWIINGITRGPDHRNRPEEFTDRSGCSKAELMTRFESAVQDSDRIVSGVSADQLLEARRIQGFDETVMSAILNSVTHLNGHAQEIVYITRLQLGDSYKYAWTPTTPEQGATAVQP